MVVPLWRGVRNNLRLVKLGASSPNDRLVATPPFAQRPNRRSDEVSNRIVAPRGDWRWRLLVDWCAKGIARSER